MGIMKWDDISDSELFCIYILYIFLFYFLFFFINFVIYSNIDESIGQINHRT